MNSLIDYATQKTIYSHIENNSMNVFFEHEILLEVFEAFNRLNYLLFYCISQSVYKDLYLLLNLLFRRKIIYRKKNTKNTSTKFTFIQCSNLNIIKSCVALANRNMEFITETISPSVLGFTTTNKVIALKWNSISITNSIPVRMTFRVEAFFLCVLRRKIENQLL